MNRYQYSGLQKSTNFERFTVCNSMRLAKSFSMSIDLSTTISVTKSQG